MLSNSSKVFLSMAVLTLIYSAHGLNMPRKCAFSVHDGLVLFLCFPFYLTPYF